MHSHSFRLWSGLLLLGAIAIAVAPAVAAVAVEPLSNQAPATDDSFVDPASPPPVPSSGFATVGNSLAGMRDAGTSFARDHGWAMSDTMFFAVTGGTGLALIIVATLARRRHRRRVGWGVATDRPLPFTFPERD